MKRSIVFAALLALSTAASAAAPATTEISADAYGNTGTWGEVPGDDGGDTGL